MALLALTLALLAMTVATQVITVPLDMALNSFDDQYQGCGPDMMAELPALNRSEFRKNPLFAQVWPKAVAEWRKKGSRIDPLSSPAQAIAIMAYTLDVSIKGERLYEEFNKKVREAGRSSQEYRDNFHFKTLHFLLTDALATLWDAQGQKCRCVYRGVDKIKFKANVGDIVRFGQFASSSLCKDVIKRFGNTTVFQVQTCHGADIHAFSKFNKKEKEVLIPPFEKFKVTYVNNVEDGKRKVEIHLDSIGTYSRYKCEWLRGGYIPRIPTSSEDDHRGHQDSQRNKATKDTKATTATMAALAIMASMWSLWPPLAL
ncbi:erythroblast NAD(P)(+)--arginine ADP-ribosyltransferase-like [Catharus ustulatus]|uniref:erythroblast NAD(P)(+)--arginine ADP-ribosyltransferase-like n=1 Tax=Catharus ustulatus TaxID=91951 RepID=UPI0014098D44|nr:erythroblast NAD(P)(+)--arginine ADP-ribosyltransferase-like [Catharus ustulatus]XP_032912503.1 erythroblast NAD(P)(+)--arginine ADP-ribosyltransferase-like [Catharus ustulatus]XP_032912509.1 erythroblast NAD(P)(+)--arginine ADP-ribosyltransferase-like [Catharus ustulatus]XP_032912517.1 erythroblast NAD(P)(+)--arginine ADP-ribosyltransferase-like [Catharus ustulatus]